MFFKEYLDLLLKNCSILNDLEYSIEIPQLFS